MRYLNADTEKPISKIGLGTWQFGSPEWNYGERYAAADAAAIVARARELGVTLFDSAEIYGIAARSLSCRALVRGVAIGDSARVQGFGRSEQILGAALGPDPQAAFVATKYFPARPRTPRLRAHALASARRLGTRTIDLYQVHEPRDAKLVPPVLDAMRGLRAERVVDEVGLSNGSLDMWRTADDVLGARVLSNQVPYSLVNRTAEATILPFARANGRVVIAFSPLAQGLLSANYDRDHVPTDPGRQTNPLFLPENLDRASGLLETLRSVAKAHTATPAQIALAWVIRDPAVTAIPGAATVEQLEHNVAAAGIDLSDAEHEALTTAAAAFHPVSPPRSGADRLRRWVADRVGR